MKKIFVTIAFLIVIIGGGLWIWSQSSTKEGTGPVMPSADNTYSNETFGFSVSVPKGFTVNEAYLNQDLGPGREIPGVEFVIATSTAAGTNLSTDSHVAIEELSDVDCTPSDFLDAPSKSVSMAIAGNAFTVASSSGAGAGNFYEETVYVTQKESRCYAVRYFIHSGNIHNYDPGAVKEFDRESLVNSFDAITESLRLI